MKSVLVLTLCLFQSLNGGLCLSIGVPHLPGADLISDALKPIKNLPDVANDAISDMGNGISDIVHNLMPSEVTDALTALKNMTSSATGVAVSVVGGIPDDLRGLLHSIDMPDPALLKGELPFNDYNPSDLFNKLPGYGKTWMYFPNAAGIPTVGFLKLPDGVPTISVYKPTSRYVKFNLYTQHNRNESQELKVDDEDALCNSNFDPSKPTKFVAHGWLSDGSADTCQFIKNNFLEQGDYNVIIVDWGQITSNILYPIPMYETRNVGKLLADLIFFLGTKGLNPGNIHLIGHSLGAHVCGIAGHHLEGKLPRITGLDPAFPGFFNFTDEDHKLSPDDAGFVDVIHTCAGVLGVWRTTGDLDFYPNGGTPSQPGCFGLTQMKDGCSHGRSWKYFASSILNKDDYPATKCDSWSHFKDGKCENNTEVMMGERAPSTARGVYYLSIEDFKEDDLFI